MDLTAVVGLGKPVGTEPFVRSTLNANSDKIDKQVFVLGLMAAYFGTLSKGPLVKSGITGKPESQAISGPGGLTGSITWTFSASQITETLSITAPTAFSITKTVDLTDLSEEWTVS